MHINTIPDDEIEKKITDDNHTLEKTNERLTKIIPEITSASENKEIAQENFDKLFLAHDNINFDNWVVNLYESTKKQTEADNEYIKLDNERKNLIKLKNTLENPGSVNELEIKLEKARIELNQLDLKNKVFINKLKLIDEKHNLFLKTKYSDGKKWEIDIKKIADDYCTINEEYEKALKRSEELSTEIYKLRLGIQVQKRKDILLSQQLDNNINNNEVLAHSINTLSDTQLVYHIDTATRNIDNLVITLLDTPIEHSNI